MAKNDLWFIIVMPRTSQIKSTCAAMSLVFAVYQAGWCSCLFMGGFLLPEWPPCVSERHLITVSPEVLRLTCLDMSYFFSALKSSCQVLSHHIRSVTSLTLVSTCGQPYLITVHPSSGNLADFLCDSGFCLFYCGGQRSGLLSLLPWG